VGRGAAERHAELLNGIRTAIALAFILLVARS